MKLSVRLDELSMRLGYAASQYEIETLICLTLRRMCNIYSVTRERNRVAEHGLFTKDLFYERVTCSF